MIVPPFLRKGDVIALTAPARKVSRDEMAPAIRFLEESGFVVAEGEHLYGESHQFSGTDRERLSDLQRAFSDPSVRAVLCARGGYGCLRFADHLDLSHLQKDPKWLAGFSDVTVLHELINRQGICTLHSPMAINFPASPGMARLVADCLSGKCISPPKEYGQSLNVSGNARGILSGGNLSILYALQGSMPPHPNEGKIVFLEDLDEYLYHIDRMVLSLKRGGFFEGCAGIVAGGLTDMRDNAIAFGKTAEEILHEHLGSLGVPLGFGIRAGHIKENHPLVLGAEAELVVTENTTEIRYTA